MTPGFLEPSFEIVHQCAHAQRDRLKQDIQFGCKLTEEKDEILHEL